MTRAWGWIAGVCMAGMLQGAHAADFFEDGKLVPRTLAEAIPTATTAGGYAIYPGEGKWQFLSGSIGDTTGRASAIPLGYVQLNQLEGGTTFARLYITVNLQQNDASYWTNALCAPGHLVLSNRNRGKNDACMTIDPVLLNVGTTPTLFLRVSFNNTASSGRYYRQILDLNPALLGVRNTGTGDWSAEAVASRPYEKELLDRITAWGDQVLERSIRAFGFSKPQDAYDGLPSFRSLLPVPPEAADRNYPISFLSALTDIQHKPTIKAIAYAPYEGNRVAWGNAWGYQTQADADKNALKNCETNRPSTAPACTIYPLAQNPAP